MNHNFVKIPSHERHGDLYPGLSLISSGIFIFPHSSSEFRGSDPFSKISELISKICNIKCILIE